MEYLVKALLGVPAASAVGDGEEGATGVPQRVGKVLEGASDEDRRSLLGVVLQEIEH